MGPEKPKGRRCLLDGPLVGKLHLLQLEEVLQLRVVYFPVAPDEDADRPFVRVVDDGLEELVRCDPEERGNLVYPPLVRRLHTPVKALFRGDGTLRESHLGPLQVGRVTAAVAGDDDVLTGVGEHHELVGEAPAYLAGVGLDDAEPEPAPREDIDVRLVHLLVALLRPGLVDIEAVGVLHRELAGAHDPEAGSDLVAELVLDLVEVDGEVLVGLHFPPHQIGDHLLVGGPRHSSRLFLSTKRRSSLPYFSHRVLSTQSSFG